MHSYFDPHRYYSFNPNGNIDCSKFTEDRLREAVSGIRINLSKYTSSNSRRIDCDPEINEFFWVEQLSDLQAIERCFRESADYSADAIEQIFSQHIEEMKDYGFGVNKELQWQRSSPVQSAALFKSPMLIKALLNSGASPDHGYRSSPLHKVCVKPGINFPASQELKDETIQVLAENGANLNIVQDPTWSKVTPVWMAAHFCETKSVETLARYGADVNQPTGHALGDSTPLQAAAKSACLETVEALIGLGANVLAENGDGKTALDIAVNQLVYNIRTTRNLNGRNDIIRLYAQIIHTLGEESDKEKTCSFDFPVNQV